MLRAIMAASAAALTLSATTARAEDLSAKTAAEVTMADTAFAGRAAEVGEAKAFLEFMDPKDSLAFEGGPPVQGAQAIYQAHGGDKPAPGKLAWKVAQAFGSQGGDMGVTTGTWSYTPNDTAKKPITGRYVTVWRRDAAGHCKGLIDIGNPD